MGKLKLKNPISINGRNVEDLNYDTNEITPALFTEAEARCRVAAGKNVAIIPAAEFDFSLHLYLGFASILAANPKYDFLDIERIHGRDLVSVMKIGRNFLMKSGESMEDNSDEPLETTAEHSMQASESSSRVE